MEYEPDGYGTQASFDGYKVFYYDNGTKYNCRIKYEN